MNNAKILIITHEDDEHVPYVARHLTSEYRIIDPYSLTEGNELTYRHMNGKSVVIYKGERLENVKSVWYRKPRKIRDHPLESVDELYRGYATTAVERHMGMLRACFENARWISDYYSIAKAEHKLWQLDVASRIGFLTPDTVMTSDDAVAVDFISQYPAAIVKTLGAEFPTIDGKGSAFPTTRIQNSSVAIQGLQFAPAIFQEAIDPKFELRVTVVGDKVFAASIVDDQSTKLSDAMRDWRLPHLFGEVTFQKADLNHTTAQQCIELVRTMGLQFGAIDLIVDKNDKVWFLEVNPNGQWAFIEEDTGLAIGKSIAELLEQV